MTLYILNYMGYNATNMVKYRVLGSPDVYAVQYDNGNIIKTAREEKYQRLKEEFEYACGIPNHDNCTKKLPLNDIREVDNIGKFALPKIRYISPQFR